MTHEEIREIIPVVSTEEVQVAERYFRENYDELMAQDRRIRERNANRVPTPEIEEILRRGGEKTAALQEEFRKRKDRNGDRAAG